LPGKPPAGVEQLPVRGSVAADAPVAARSWLQAWNGVPDEVVFEEDLLPALCEPDGPPPQVLNRSAPAPTPWLGLSCRPLPALLGMVVSFVVVHVYGSSRPGSGVRSWLYNMACDRTITDSVTELSHPNWHP
jgi:hypothetical protein